MEVGKKKMYYGVGSACGTKPNLGSALAPNILLKKRLDFEAPAATTIGEPVSGFKRTARKASTPIPSSDFRWSAKWMIQAIAIDQTLEVGHRRIIYIMGKMIRSTGDQQQPVDTYTSQDTG